VICLDYIKSMIRDLNNRIDEQRMHIKMMFKIAREIDAEIQRIKEVLDNVKNNHREDKG